MLLRVIRCLGGDESGAVSPLYAVAILALTAMAGIGFDYGRMVALDTELQNAADQAALAAATQLDGGDDAMIRARNAATAAFATAASPYVNETRFANDNAGRPITSLGFKFYESYEDDDTLGDEVVDDADGADARVVEVTANSRTVNYALTPLIGAISDSAIGRAMATLESAVCNVPPMMFCVPNGPSGLADTSFPTSSDIGRGLKLHMSANAADPWAPGNFGFLNIDYDTFGGGNPNHTLGLNADFLGCTGDVIESRTGVRDPEADALNSRFDYYSGSVNKNSCDTGTKDFCPSSNVRKDYVLEIPTGNGGGNGNGNGNGGGGGGQTCESYSPTGNIDWVANSDVGSLPDDNSFEGSVGSGSWNYSAYFARRNALNASYPIPTELDFEKSSMAEVTRYDVYKWELKDAANRLKPEDLGINPATGNRMCSYPQPKFGTAVVAGDDQKDRRVMTVAAVDCTGLNGSAPVRILRWVDIFLLKPALQGSTKEFVAEIVGPARLADGGSGFQYFGRKKAVLIR